jgi:pimeloyl-ACP methyl ester carboxylesterase
MTCDDVRARAGSTITLSDGRKVQFEQYGDPAGIPALWFHGGFSSRLEASPLDVPARELGVRLLSLDRPGLGGSDPLPARTVTGYAKDVVELLDALELERVTVGGLSNGGMFTMAVASEIPHRVVRAVPVNSTTPVTDKAAQSALSFAARATYRFMARHPERLSRRVENAKPPGKLATALNRLTNPDARLFDDPATAAFWAANLEQARRQRGTGAITTELTLASTPWGFDHRAVSVPVVMVSGEKDAGLGYAKVWARELPQGQLVVVPGGHTGLLAPAVARRIAALLAGQP